jgi:hypothetical protein
MGVRPRLLPDLGLEELTYRRYPLRRHVARLALYSVVDNLGYRQLTSVWRLWGIVEFIRKEKSWGTMDRKGFTPVAPEPVEQNQAMSVAAADR